MTRRIRIATLFLVLVLAISLLSGCSTITSIFAPKNDPSALRDPKILVIGIDEEPLSLNPYTLEGSSAATSAVLSNILWGLLVVTPNMNYAPRLAERVPTVENGLVTINPFTVTYAIRRGACWNDGVPITAEDVKYTWETLMNPNLPIADRHGYDQIGEVQIVSERTVRFVFKNPYANYLDLFTQGHPILPKHIMEGQEFGSAIQKILPFASGPYKFTGWEKGKRIVLIRNKAFWTNKAIIPSVVFTFAPASETLLNDFVDDHYDVLFSTKNPDYLDELKILKNKTLKADPSPRWEQLGFNTERPPLDNPNVRRAISLSIDRSRIAQNATDFNQVLQSVLVPEQSPYYYPAWDVYGYDPSRAQTYLQRAGYVKNNLGVYEKAGQALTITLFYSQGDNIRNNVAQTIKDNLSDVGINVIAKEVDPQTLFDTLLPRGNYEAAIWSWRNYPGPALMQYFSSEAIPPYGLNYYRYRNILVDTDLRLSDSSMIMQQRVNYLTSAQRQLSDDAALLPLYQRLGIIAFDNRVKGVVNNTTLETPFWNLGEWHIVSNKGNSKGD